MGIDPELMRRVASGEYVVDPHAVAAAMMRRRADLDEVRRLSKVLIARQDDGLAPGPSSRTPDPATTEPIQLTPAPAERAADSIASRRSGAVVNSSS